MFRNRKHQNKNLFKKAITEKLDKQLIKQWIKCLKTKHLRKKAQKLYKKEQVQPFKNKQELVSKRPIFLEKELDGCLNKMLLKII